MMVDYGLLGMLMRLFEKNDSPQKSYYISSKEKMSSPSRHLYDSKIRLF
jgi:hypothetical protein